jgi:hypothetical protein
VYRPSVARRSPKHVARAWRDNGRTINICKGC